ALIPNAGIFKFFSTPDAVSTFSRGHAEKWKAQANYKTFWMSGVTPNMFLRSLPGPYNFISLDAEGLSLELLELMATAIAKCGWFKSLRLICVEAEGEQRVKVSKLLKKAWDFFVIGETGENIICGIP
ncbi:unnamed protein product, partial [marine sediment metagenome]